MLHECLGPTDVDELGVLAISQPIQLVAAMLAPVDEAVVLLGLVTPDLVDDQLLEPRSLGLVPGDHELHEAPAMPGEHNRELLKASREVEELEDGLAVSTHAELATHLVSEPGVHFLQALLQEVPGHMLDPGVRFREPELELVHLGHVGVEEPFLKSMPARCQHLWVLVEVVDDALPELHTLQACNGGPDEALLGLQPGGFGFRARHPAWGGWQRQNCWHLSHQAATIKDEQPE